MSKRTNNPWSKKTNAELREIIREGIKEINQRRPTVKLKSEKEFIDRIASLQGYTQKGTIRVATGNVSHRELLYRARLIDQYLEVDTSSSQAFDKLNAKANDARLTFNARYDMNLTQKEYADMVEIMNAFTDQTQGFGSSQIAQYYEYAKDTGADTSKLPRIFAEAVQMQGVTEHERNEWIFDKIDELNMMR